MFLNKFLFKHISTFFGVAGLICGEGSLSSDGSIPPGTARQLWTGEIIVIMMMMTGEFTVIDHH